MRKILLSLAAAGAALAIATPASAQYYQPYGYGYGHDYGYNSWSRAGELEQRIDNLLRGLDGVRNDQRGRLYQAAIRLDRELRYAARNGLSPYEAQAFDVRIDELERWKGYASYNRGYGYRDYGYGHNGYDHGYYRNGHDDDRWDRDDD